MDPIADMLIRIKNAGLVRADSAQFPYSNIKFSIANLLMTEGYVKSVSKKGKKVKRTIEIGLLYDKDGKPRIHDVKRESKLSRRIYKGFRTITPYRRGYGMTVLSTTKGIIPDKIARKEKIGGEVLFKIW
ncbi:30S ribosomal protein S8 [bacterium]|nr:30S ribosomal protein S8 [bacterium]MCI0565985.1 30S ribosomal protein S8 [bacterium]MCI0679886.1 30S ribosomal protein S8 [bacterium]